jgi:hypothetical protein
MKEEHRIQVRVDGNDWERAERAATGKGLATVAALCRYLLAEEFARQGLEEGAGRAARAPAGDDEHRIQVRVKEAEWGLAQEAAAANGLPSVSGLCRWLLEKEFERLAAQKAPAVPRRGKKRARRQ